MSDSSKAKKGVLWMGLLRGSTRGMSLIKNIILARLLSPSQFGIVGIAILVLGLLEMLTETGINVVLIQQKEDWRKYISSAFVVSIGRGILITLLLFLTSPLISFFFKSPEALPYLFIISLVPFIRGFINPSVVQFQKQLDFHKEFLFRFTLSFIDISVALTVAFLFASTASIVYGMIASAIFEVVLSQLLLDPRPRFSIKLDQIRILVREGKWITIAGIFQYLFQNFDNIVVGRLLSTQALGLYQMTYTISSVPITEVADTVNRVAFPYYSSIRHDTDRLKRTFLFVTLAITLVTIPLSIILFLFPEQIILLILGEKWLSATSTLRVLAIFGSVRAISGSSSALFLALKKQRYVTIVTLVSILGLAIPIVPLVLQYQTVGAAIAVICGTFIAVPVVVYYLRKVLFDS